MDVCCWLTPAFKPPLGKHREYEILLGKHVCYSCLAGVAVSRGHPKGYRYSFLGWATEQNIVYYCYLSIYLE